jgi:hypothetical protein
MPAYSCEKDFDKMLHPEELAFLISLDALQASIKTVFANRKATHTVDGMFFYKRGKQGTLRRFQRDFSKLPPCKTVRSSLSDQEQRVADARSIDLQGLQQIVRMSIRRGIVLKLVVYPLHALQIEQQYQCGARRTKWSVLKQILAMTERENSSLVELWDFEGYHAIGTEPISDAPGVYWQDPGHFNYEFGNIMLDEMFSVEPINLGIRLNTRNLEDRATSESSARKYYIDGHQEFLKKLNELLSSPVT